MNLGPKTRSEVVLRTVLSSATMLAVLDAWVVVAIGLSGLWSMPMTGGCGGGAAILLFVTGAITLVAVGWLVLVTLIAVIGVVFLWVRYHVGAGFAFAANVLVLVTLGVVATDPSVLGLWKIVVLVLAPTPVIALAVMLWVWTARTPALGSKIIVAVVAVVALSPSAAVYSYGLVRDVNSVIPRSAPVAVLQADVGCGPSR